MSATAFQQNYNDAEGAGWAALDMSILSAGRGAAAILPREMFGSAWQLVVDLAAGAGCPVDYSAMSFIACVTALVGAKRRVQPFASSTSWREPCIIWTACVGDPSTNKSPGLEAAISGLEDIERDYTAAHKSSLPLHEAKLERAKAERARWQEAVKAATKEHLATPPMPDEAILPDDPIRRRLVVKDTTPEALAELLSGNPNGLMHFRDELAGWLMSFDRYAPGGREFWLEAYGGRSYVVDRKSSKVPLSITFNGVTVLGGIQPEKLSECLLNASDDGLVARFLWAWPDPIPFTRPRQIADLALLERIYRRVEALHCDHDEYDQAIPVVLPLHPDASDIFEAWVNDQSAAVQDAASLYKGFCGKLRGTVLRLALVTELIEWAAGPQGPEPDQISITSLMAAIEFAESYAKPTALRVFGDAARPPAERDGAILARHILKTKAEIINLREIKRSSGMPTLKKEGAADAAIENLIDAGWLRRLRDPNTNGRPKSDFLVNPAVHEAKHG